MKGIILLNGEPYSGKIDDTCAVIYCCDGAYEWAHGRVRIDKNIGDFDSLGYMPDPPPEQIFPSEKDYTDGEIALLKLMSEGVNEIAIYGGGGGREDHFLGNLHLLYLAHSRGVKCSMITDRSEIYPASGRVDFNGLKDRTVSVLPFGKELHIMDFKGLKYAYPQTLSYGECRGISNIVVENEAFLCVDGVALIIVNRGKV